MQGRYERSKWSETIGSVRNRRGAAVQCNCSVQPNSEARRLSTMQLQPPPQKQKHINNSQGTQWPTTHSEELAWEAASLEKQTGHTQVCFWHVSLPQLIIITHSFWLAPLLKYKLHLIQDQGMAKSCFRVCGESMTQTCDAWTNPTFKQLEIEHTLGILSA